MCGLSGIAGRGIMEMDIEFYKDLVYLSAFRGKHSTGISTIMSKNNVYTTRKHAISPAEFLDTYGGKKGYLMNTHADIQIAHARWATKGAVTDENAHPFDTKKYIGAHNGTLVDSRFQSKDGKTDSELMFMEMDQKGIVETIGSLNKQSAWAVSIYDKFTRKLWLGRNIHRTLFVAFVHGADVMVWSSEQEIIEFAAARERGPKVSIFRLMPGKLYEIDVRKIKAGNHTPWIVHDLPTPKDPLLADDWKSSTSGSRSVSNWDGIMSREGDLDDIYTWDTAKGQYVVKSRSDVASILDEVEESVSASRKAEEEFQKTLLI